MKGRVIPWCVAAAFVLSACQAVPVGTNQGAGQATPAGAAQAGPAAAPGSDTLTFASSGVWEPMDPELQNSRFEDSYVLAVFESLFQQNKDGTFVPMLALSDAVSSDGLSHTLQLRSGVKFHDGSTMTSADVKFSLDRRRGLDTLKKGQNAFYITSIDSVDTNGPDAVVIHLNRLDPVLDNELGYLGGIIEPMDYIHRVGDDGFNLHPIGTGPYKYVSNIPGSELRLTVFADYWNTSGSDPALASLASKPGRVKNIVLKTILDQASSIAQLQAGQIDVIGSILPNQVLPLQNAGFKTQNMNSDNMQMFHFNELKYPEFTDPRVGQAFNYAVNREQIAKAVYSPVAVTLVGAMDPPERPWYDKTVTVYPYDPAKAKSLLQDAQFDLGKQVVVEVGISDTQGFVDVAQIVAQNLTAVGVKVQVNQVDPSVSRQQSLDKSQPQLTTTNVPITIGDMVSADAAVMTCASLFSLVCRPDLEKLLVDAAGSPAGDARTAAISKIDHYVHDNPVGIYLWIQPFVVAMKSNVDWTPAYDNEWFLIQDFGYKS
jgi:peptide/nickel transport system substrate-binding protein